MAETKFAYIYEGNEKLGDVCLFSSGTASVTNDWFGVVQWFDDPASGHDDALRYIKSRMTENPRFVL